MRSCEFCGTENTDVAGHCSTCNEPLTAEAAEDDLRNTEQISRRRHVRKEFLWAAGGVLAMGAIASAMVVGHRGEKERESVRAFYTSFRDTDDLHAAAFWKCMTRTDGLPADNVELARSLDSAVAAAAGGYAKYARASCLPLVASAPPKLEALSPPAELEDTFSDYTKAVRALDGDAERYVDSIAALEKQRDVERLLERRGAAYHRRGGERAEAWAYDRFMRCAVPALNTLDGPQALLEQLSLVLHAPGNTVDRWRRDCVPALQRTSAVRPHPDFAKTAALFAPDDRDVEAFGDCLRAASERDRKSLHAPFEQAWYRFAQARQALDLKFAESLHH